jgi:hypothetical protein
MTTGTAPQPPPSSDLIDRFNAIIDDVPACVAVESMKAAGVPWVLRMILAPLLRRRIARWSAAFSAMVADPRAARAVAPAVAPALDLPVARPHPDSRSRTPSAAARARFASVPDLPEVPSQDTGDFREVEPLSGKPASRPSRPGARPIDRPKTRIVTVGGQGGWCPPSSFSRPGFKQCGPPELFSGAGRLSASCAYFVTI